MRLYRRENIGSIGHEEALSLSDLTWRRQPFAGFSPHHACIDTLNSGNQDDIGLNPIIVEDLSIRKHSGLRLYRSRNGLRDSLRSAIQFLVGPSEGGALDPRPGSGPPPALPATPPRTLVDVVVDRLPAGVRRHVEAWRRGGVRHRLCKHQHACVAAALQGGVRLFILGYGLQALIKLVGSLSQISRRPRAPFDALLHPDNAAFAKFLGTFATVFQAVNCILRWSRDKDEGLHGLLAGFLAGWSMMFYKSSTIAMYMTSKLAEVLWFKGVEKGVLPLIKCADILIYTVSTSVVFHAAVFEPHTIRAAYWKFLVRLTNGRFREMNRKLLDVFGTNASKAFPNFWPKYDPRFTNLPVTMPTSL